MNALLKQNHINFSIYKHDNCEKKGLKVLEDLEDLQSEVKQVRFVEKIGKQGYHYNIRELFEPITKTLTDTSQ